MDINGYQNFEDHGKQTMLVTLGPVDETFLVGCGLRARCWPRTVLTFE